MAPKKQKIKSSQIILVLVLLIGCAMVSWLNIIAKAKENVPEFTQHLLNQAQEDAKFAVELLHQFDTSTTDSHTSQSYSKEGDDVSSQVDPHDSLDQSSSNNNIPVLPISLPDLPTISQQMQFTKNGQDNSFEQQVVYSPLSPDQLDSAISEAGEKYVEIPQHHDTKDNTSPDFDVKTAPLPSLPEVSTYLATADKPVSTAVRKDIAATTIEAGSTTPRSKTLSLNSVKFENVPINLAGLGSRRPYFIHFHKAGGTTLCHQAKAVNKMNAPLRNCNMAGDGPRTLADGIGDGNRDWTCEDRTQYLEQHCMQFFAAERWLDETLCLRNFLYITVLREPIKRIESNCRYERIPAENAIEWMTKTTHLPSETRVYEGTASVDNFYVRTLCGPDVFHKKVGMITKEDLEYALHRLSQFEVLLILEDFESGVIQLEHLIGWERPKQKKDEHRSFGSGDVTIKFSPEQRQVLIDHNQFDLVLYDYAVERSKAITEAISEKRRSSSSSSPLSWRELMNRKQSQEEKKQCSQKFGTWEANAKREKAAWLRKRELEANKRKRVAQARTSFIKSGQL